MMTHKLWRLSEGGANNLGLACTDDGLVLGRTFLVGRRGGRFAVHDRNEIEPLLVRVIPRESVERVMSGLATVAAAKAALWET